MTSNERTYSKTFTKTNRGTNVSNEMAKHQSYITHDFKSILLFKSIKTFFFKFE